MTASTPASTEGRPRLLLLDGHSLAYRAFFALPESIATSRGEPTNAIYGFALMLKRVLEKYPPDYIAVAMDSSAPTARHAQYSLYKAEQATDILWVWSTT